MRYKLTIEYDGTDLLGWQKQLDGPSAQGLIETSLFMLFQKEIEVFGAGRTDAGVHAIAQVAHFDTETDLDTYRIKEALNAHLRALNAPVCILEAEEIDDSFHSRFSALGRGYIYKILCRRAPAILEKNRVWQLPNPLDMEKMQQGAKYLLGKHDFSSFRAAACQADSPIKTLDKLDIIIPSQNMISPQFVFRKTYASKTQNAEAESTLPVHEHSSTGFCDQTFHKNELWIRVEAKSFLHHQVRNIVGTLKLVGEGSLKPEDIKTILESKDRKKAGPTAPACGLYLSNIWY